MTMGETSDADQQFIADLLGELRHETPLVPPDLSTRAIRKVQTLITARDLLDLTTVVFLLRVCAPLMDLVAAALGADDQRNDKGRRNG